jgi:ubiquinone/menaquinone biosynthesis C-methylase UbiE
MIPNKYSVRMLVRFAACFSAIAVGALPIADAFVSQVQLPFLHSTTMQQFNHPRISLSSLMATTTSEEKKVELARQKKALLELIGAPSSSSSSSSSKTKDPVLADPITKEPLEITVPGVRIGGNIPRSSSSIMYKIQSSTNSYKGSTDTYIDLLEPVTKKDTNNSNDDDPKNNNNQFVENVMKQALPFIPFSLRSSFATLSNSGSTFIPMRDLFTSPTVSFAYERGWRQGFAAAGFPGADVEAEMAMDYFAPAIASSYDGDQNNSVLVDMSCATGLFTRRFAASQNYARVLGCDYSESMLLEARRRIQSEPKLQSSLSSFSRSTSKNNSSNAKRTKTTQLDLIRLDVGQIPMQSNSVDALHAGAAMHCWPDLDAAISEIYRVLKPGGRYFATTFLSNWFRVLGTDSAGPSSLSTNQTSFQMFDSTDTLRDLLLRNGFEAAKVSVEVIGSACVVIRCEK